MSSAPFPPRHVRSVLVTGANGYIGSAVARSFAQSGWQVFGLIRRESLAAALMLDEIIPLVGTPTEPSTWLPLLYAHTRTVDVIVSNTDDLAHYAEHFAGVMGGFRELAAASSAAGVRPLLLFTSGCKDYGMTARADEAGLAPHTETSPLDPPSIVAVRTEYAAKVWEIARADGNFDGAVIRPTTVFGKTSSFYADAFVRAEEAAGLPEGKRVLVVPSAETSIAHGTHVDDCGDAYVALAEHAKRGEIAGQAFNISGHRFETAGEIARALAEEYKLDGVEYRPESGTEATKWGNALWAFSQWVGSDSIRQVTGWSDRRLLFSENIHAYRLAYEASRTQGNEAVARMAQRLATLKGR